MALTLLILSIVAMILLGAPIGVAMAVVPAVYIWITGELPLSAIPYQMYEAISVQALLAVPFFILTAEIMNASKITGRLLELARELVGRIRGGLAQMNIVGSMLFSSMNGSAVADVAAIGGVMIPAMRREGYPGPFAAAITAASSTIGAILPPSILLVILASTTSLSIGAVFTAGIIPGLMVGVALMLITYVLAVRFSWEKYRSPFKFSLLLRAAWGAIGALLIPLVILVGITSGVFTATEAGAIAALTALMLGSIVYRSLTFKAFKKAIFRATKTSSSVFIIIAASGPLSWLLNRIGALEGLGLFFLQFADNPVLLGIVAVTFILIVGMLIEPIPNVVMLGPTLFVAFTQAGFHDLQAVMVMAVGFIFGSVTPPVGVCYFTAAAISGEKIDRVAKAIIPLLAANLIVISLILWAPAVTVTLPRLVGLI